MNLGQFNRRTLFRDRRYIGIAAAAIAPISNVVAIYQQNK